MENKMMLHRLQVCLVVLLAAVFGMTAQIPGFQQPERKVKEVKQPDVLVQVDTAAAKKEIPKRLVADNAGIFSAVQKFELEQRLLAFADSTSNVIMVVTVPTLDGMASIDKAYEIGETYGVGTKDRDNGIVLLIKPKTADSRGDVAIAVGYGLEGAIPDATCSIIIRRELIPQFKRGNYYQGAVNAVNILMPLAAGEFSSSEYGKGVGKDDDAYGFWGMLLVIGIIVALLLPKNGDKGSNSGSRGGGSGPIIFYSGGRSSFGGSSGGFGGGFGGFGGGSFGGGGASGSW